MQIVCPSVWLGRKNTAYRIRPEQTRGNRSQRIAVDREEFVYWNAFPIFAPTWKIGYTTTKPFSDDRGVTVGVEMLTALNRNG